MGVQDWGYHLWVRKSLRELIYGFDFDQWPPADRLPSPDTSQKSKKLPKSGDGRKPARSKRHLCLFRRLSGPISDSITNISIFNIWVNSYWVRAYPVTGLTQGLGRQQWTKHKMAKVPVLIELRVHCGGSFWRYIFNLNLFLRRFACKRKICLWPFFIEVS